MSIKHRKPNRRVKVELINRKILQSQAALDLGISRPRFNAICNGWDIPSPEIRRRISQYLGLDESDLFPG